LAQWHHLLQLCECIDCDLLVFENVGHLWAYSFEKSSLSDDAQNINIESFCNPLLRDSSLDRLYDHLVLLDRDQSLTAMIA
jgi:hypothetical protein